MGLSNADGVFPERPGFHVASLNFNLVSLDFSEITAHLVTQCSADKNSKWFYNLHEYVDYYR